MTSGSGGAGRFSDWDEPASAGSSVGESPSPSIPLFMESPLYSIENHQHLAYIKNSLSIAFRISALLLIPTGMMSFVIFSDLLSPYSSIDFWEFISFITSASSLVLSVLSIVFFFLKKPSSMTFSAYALSIPFCVLFIFMIDEIPFREFNEFMFLLTFFIIGVSMCAFVFIRKIRTNACTKALATSKFPILNTELKDAIRNTYINTFEFINRAKYEIIQGTLSDRLETSLIGQLASDSILNHNNSSQYKTPELRSALRTLSTHKRHMIGFLFIPISNFFALLIINGLLFKSNIVPWFITYFFLFTVCFLNFHAYYENKILYALAGLSYAYSIFYLIIVILSQFYKPPFLSLSESNLLTGTAICALISSLILTGIMHLLIDHRERALRHLTFLKIPIDYKSIQALLSMFFILCGFQKNVELADEDGWE